MFREWSDDSLLSLRDFVPVRPPLSPTSEFIYAYTRLPSDSPSQPYHSHPEEHTSQAHPSAADLAVFFADGAAGAQAMFTSTSSVGSSFVMNELPHEHVPTMTRNASQPWPSYLTSPSNDVEGIASPASQLEGATLLMAAGQAVPLAGTTRGWEPPMPLTSSQLDDASVGMPTQPLSQGKQGLASPTFTIPLLARLVLLELLQTRPELFPQLSRQTEDTLVNAITHSNVMQSIARDDRAPAASAARGQDVGNGYSSNVWAPQDASTDVGSFGHSSGAYASTGANLLPAAHTAQASLGHDSVVQPGMTYGEAGDLSFGSSGTVNEMVFQHLPSEAKNLAVPPHASLSYASPLSNSPSSGSFNASSALFPETDVHSVSHASSAGPSFTTARLSETTSRPRGVRPWDEDYVSSASSSKLKRVRSNFYASDGASASASGSGAGSTRL